MDDELVFDAKYYGPCPDISATTEVPDIDVCLAFMSDRKREAPGRHLTRSRLVFSRTGMAVMERRGRTSEVVVQEWPVAAMASCATTAHPKSAGRRIGLVKIREGPKSAPRAMWHLFKFYSRGQVDNLSECFRWVVTCSLKDLKRQCAVQLARHVHGHPRSPPPAWDEPEISPSTSPILSSAQSMPWLSTAHARDSGADGSDEPDENDERGVIVPAIVTPSAPMGGRRRSSGDKPPHRTHRRGNYDDVSPEGTKRIRRRSRLLSEGTPLTTPAPGKPIGAVTTSSTA